MKWYYWAAGAAALWWFRWDWAPMVGLTPTQGFPGIAEFGDNMLNTEAFRSGGAPSGILVPPREGPGSPSARLRGAPAETGNLTSKQRSAIGATLGL